MIWLIPVECCTGCVAGAVLFRIVLCMLGIGILLCSPCDKSLSKILNFVPQIGFAYFSVWAETSNYKTQASNGQTERYMHNIWRMWGINKIYTPYLNWNIKCVRRVEGMVLQKQ